MQQKIYINGDIVTVDDRRPAAEAVVVREGRILYVGDTETALGYQNLQSGDDRSGSTQSQTQTQTQTRKAAETEIIDLQGRTMLPGFIDPHSHYLMAASTANYAALSSPPIGNVESIDDIIRLLKAEIQAKRIPAGKMVFGWGYDESLLKEGRVPTNRELDQVSTTHPVYIIHQSGHKGVGNSLLLRQFGIDESAKDPEGGHIGRYPGTTMPNGTLEEKSSMAVMMTELANPNQETLLRSLQAGGELYARNGITTAQDGAMQRASVALAEMAGKTGLLKIDLVGYLLISSLDDFKAVDNFISKTAGNIGETAAGIVTDFPGTAKTGPYRDHFRIGGAKLLLDGSPQAKTAWLSKPYFIPPPGENASYRGYPFYEKDEFVTAVYEECLRRKMQILTHANGDQASEQLITCFAGARRSTGISTDIRPVMIHAQTVREDQLDRMKELGIIPSFFQSHTYFWGDWHLNSVLGEERGMRISPVQSAIRRKMVYTMHQDTPVVPPNMIFTLWTAVNRRTRSGRIIGADQRISPIEAIRGITINGARQYFEEDSKGSITPGKRADLVILDKNPLKTAADAIRDIQVMETIKDGETIYRKS
jgi:predicted amidohydrolase YtcJ